MLVFFDNFCTFVTYFYLLFQKIKFSSKYHLIKFKLGDFASCLFLFFKKSCFIIWDISFENFLIEIHSKTDFFEKNECILSWEYRNKNMKISMVFQLGNQVKAFFDRFYDAWSDKSVCITDLTRFLWFLDSVLST